MDIKALHEKFKDNDSPSVEGQIRWLHNQGFTQDQIDQAIIAVYFDIERGIVPNKWVRGNEVVYLLPTDPRPNENWSGEPITKGFDLDQYLLKVSKEIRTKELSDKVAAIGVQVSKMKAQWESDYIKANSKPGFFKRLFAKSEV